MKTSVVKYLMRPDYKTPGSGPDIAVLARQLHADLDEALKSSAPLLWEQAERTCNPDNYAYQNCMAYHRIWQYLVLWKLSTSMRPDSEFILDTIRGFAHSGEFRKILISGTADYSLLAHVLQAFSPEKISPVVTVLDRCLTSLQINKWYADRSGVNIILQQGDIFDYENESKFDAICTHSFLIWFSLEHQYQLIKKWHALLKPGGKVLTTLRLRSGPANVPTGYTEQDAHELRRRTMDEALARNLSGSNYNADLMGNVAYQYAKGRKRYVVDNENVYQEMFEKAGFVIEQMNLIVSPDPQLDRPSGPASGNNGRLQIVATRS